MSVFATSGALSAFRVLRGRVEGALAGGSAGVACARAPSVAAGAGGASGGRELPMAAPSPGARDAAGGACLGAAGGGAGIGAVAGGVASAWDPPAVCGAFPSGFESCSGRRTRILGFCSRNRGSSTTAAIATAASARPPMRSGTSLVFGRAASAAGLSFSSTVTATSRSSLDLSARGEGFGAAMGGWVAWLSAAVSRAAGEWMACHAANGSGSCPGTGIRAGRGGALTEGGSHCGSGAWGIASTALARSSEELAGSGALAKGSKAGCSGGVRPMLAPWRSPSGGGGTGATGS